jgi:hypothetical protein
MCMKPINHIPSPSPPPFTLPLSHVANLPILVKATTVLLRNMGIKLLYTTLKSPFPLFPTNRNIFSLYPLSCMAVFS